MSVHTQFSEDDILFLNKIRFDEILKTLPPAYTYVLQFDCHTDTITLEIFEQSEVAVDQQLPADTRRQLANVQFIQESGLGSISGSESQTEDLIRIIEHLSRNWVNLEGEVIDIEVSLNIPTPKNLPLKWSVPNE